MRLSEFMKSEHDSMDRMWDEFVAEEDREKAEQLFEKFSGIFTTHIRLEEEVLEPIVNKYLGLGREMGPAAMADRDHRSLEKLHQKVSDALKTGGVQELAYAQTHFRRALTKHHDREVDIYYPLFDEYISQKDWEAISRGWPVGVA